MQSIIEMQEATNEELQTPREELESPNEELHTVNEEMQHRNDLLNQLNNDLTNLLNSVNLPMLMVSADLSVRRFTPQATAILGLMPSDIGRPVPRLRLRIDTRLLEQSMLAVMQEMQPRHEQVQDEQGHWFSMRITPYRTLDNRIDGVVMTIVDRNLAGEPGEDRKARSEGDSKGAQTTPAKKSAQPPPRKR